MSFLYKTTAEISSSNSIETIRDSIVIRRESASGMQFDLFPDPSDIAELDYKNFAYHEVVMADQERKFMLDVDFKNSPVSIDQVIAVSKLFIDAIAFSIADICRLWTEHRVEAENVHLFISASSDRKVTGFHIVLDGFMFASHKDIELVLAKVQEFHSTHSDKFLAISPVFSAPDIIDKASAKASFSMRLPGSKKYYKETRELKRRKVHYPTEDQMNMDDVNELGFLTCDSSRKCKSVCLVHVVANPRPAAEVDDTELGQALRKIKASLVGKHFNFRDCKTTGKGPLINFDRETAGEIFCDACKRNHTNDNFLYAIGEGIQDPTKDIILMCRRGNKVIEVVEAQAAEEFVGKYAFDVESLKGKPKTAIMPSLNAQKAEHKRAIEHEIRKKSVEFSDQQFAEHSVRHSAKTLNDKFRAEKDEALNELDRCFRNAVECSSNTGNSDAKNLDMIRDWIRDNRDRPFDLKLFEHTRLYNINDIMFKSVEQLCTFIYSNYWWTTADGIFIRESDGFKRIDKTRDGLHPRLYSYMRAQIQLENKEIIKFEGLAFWRLMAELCMKEGSKFEPYYLEFERQNHQMNPLRYKHFNLYGGLSGNFHLAKHFREELYAQHVAAFEDLAFQNFGDKKARVHRLPA